MSLKDNEDLKYIKKHYGEDFAKMCRTLFPTLLEQPGFLKQLISEHVEPTKSFVRDMATFEDNKEFDYENSFKNFIYSFVDVEKEKPEITTNKTAKELLDEAGYILYPECQTEEEIQSFKKYYATGEELCTFRGGRLDYCRVWFAVKKNVDEIKRENFKAPNRQDEYGTSVISIQYTKQEPSTLSIKNRYNHAVNNPDATFSNNLDNIIPGLANAFTRDFHIIANETNAEGMEFYPYLQLSGKLYRANNEIDNVWYCSNNVIVDNFQLKRFDKTRYIVVDKYVIDKQEKTIVCYNNTKDKEKDQDEFTKTIGNIKSIQEVTNKGGRDIVITPENGEKIVIGINDNNQLISYTNHNVTKVGDNFLADSLNIEMLDMKNLTTVGDNFLENRLSYATSTPIKITSKIEYAGNNFFPNFSTEDIEIDLSHIKELGNSCFNTYIDNKGDSLSFPMLQKCGDHCFGDVLGIKTADFASLTTAGEGFFIKAPDLVSFKANNLKTLSHFSFNSAPNLEHLEIESLQHIGDSSFMHVKSLQEFIAPDLTSTDLYFLQNAESLTTVYAPKLGKLEEYSLCNVPNLQQCDLSSVQEIHNNCFKDANSLKHLDLPNATSIGNGSFVNMSNLETLNAPKATNIGYRSFLHIPKLEKLSLPRLKIVEFDCFKHCDSLKELVLPAVTLIEADSFTYCPNLEKMDIPQVKSIFENAFEQCGITELNMPYVEHMADECFSEVPNLNVVNTPWLISIGQKCFDNAPALTSFDAPDLTQAAPDFLQGATNLEEINCNIIPQHIQDSMKQHDAKEKKEQIENSDITL